MLDEEEKKLLLVKYNMYEYENIKRLVKSIMKAVGNENIMLETFMESIMLLYKTNTGFLEILHISAEEDGEKYWATYNIKFSPNNSYAMIVCDKNNNAESMKDLYDQLLKNKKQIISELKAFQNYINFDNEIKKIKKRLIEQAAINIESECGVNKLIIMTSKNA